MQDSFEKIKIAVSADINKILNRDVESFEFRKKNLSLNKNDFINTLIVSYFEEFSKQEKEERERLSGLAKSLHLKKDELVEFVDKVFKEIYRGYSKKDLYSESLSFRPTKNSIYTIDFIQNNLLIGTTLSEYFRRLFYRYCSLPQYQREKILFKDIYHKIQEAITKRQQIYISTRFNAGNRTIISPYSFSVVKEETFNYLLCKDKDTYRSFRLSKIQDCIIVDKKASFTEQDIAHFEKMMKYGPQYLYLDDEEETEIILTQKGIKLFRGFYVYRPIVDRVENNHYFFKCSLDQLAQYFSRFGAECYVVKPIKLRKWLIKYYKTAYEKLTSSNAECN